MFAVILIYSTLHMLAPPVRLAVLETLLDHVNESGWLLIVDEASNIKDFDRVIVVRDLKWNTKLSQRGDLFVRCS